MRYTLFCNTANSYCIADHVLGKSSFYNKSLTALLSNLEWRIPLEGGNSYKVLQGTHDKAYRILARFDDLNILTRDYPELFI